MNSNLFLCRPFFCRQFSWWSTLSQPCVIYTLLLDTKTTKGPLIVGRPTVLPSQPLTSTFNTSEVWSWLVYMQKTKVKRSGSSKVWKQPNLSPFSLMHTHTHTHLTALFPGLPRLAGNKRWPIWILLEQETVSGNGISWAAICKSASRSRQITMPLPHHSFFTGWMPFLPPNQQRQSTEGSC